MGNIARDEKLTYLFKGILTLDSIDDCYDFFADLCTPAELQEMSRRMQAAKMLRDGYIYNEIASTTGLSTATISRVNRCLKYSSDGYLKVLDEIDKSEKRRNLYDSV
ncbi:MAG: helix-turn-helix domain-containing protein [Clostridia bacterium]|nr:helix-turn-helix domain-containing protein [Clostridia bacterium]